MLREFSERVANRVGALDWVAIATLIAEMIAGCLNDSKALASAISNPTGMQRVRLGLRCRQEFGWRNGGEVARVILAEAKTAQAAFPGASGDTSFEDAVLAEINAL